MTTTKVNEFFDLSAERALSNDRNVEDPACIVYVRKWTWEGFEDRPDLSFLGLQCVGHVALGDKTDLFIYER